MSQINKNLFEINNLVKSELYNQPLDLSFKRSDELIKDLESMILIRSVENKIAEKKKEGIIKGPVHLGVGQEAVPVGISNYLTSKDRIFGAHRSHSHLLALGSDVRKLFAEILGKSTGHSKGMGGSMHLIDKHSGFMGSVPIVAGTIPIAVGSALAAKKQETKDLALSYFGDGATEEGVFHESLNLAKILKLPILFVCENNLFSSHMHISLRQPVNSVSRFALANEIKYEVIDGNDICEVRRSSKKLIKLIREGKGPCFLEAITFRWYGHVDWREDIDVGVNRSKEEVLNWKKRDPIYRLLKGLILIDKYSEETYKDFCFKIDTKIDNWWEQAMNDPYPDSKEAYKYLYK